MTPWSLTSNWKAISWRIYYKAYRKLITDLEKQLFVPDIQWIDCTSETGNDYFHCKNIVASDMDVIARSEDDDTRKWWSQHKFDNAFALIEFAHPERGIFGATPVETMHAFRKGVIEKVIKLVLVSLPASKKAAFWWSCYCISQVSDISNRVANLTKITASARMGIAFLLVILFQKNQ
jgi:hypothetical protein